VNDWIPAVAAAVGVVTVSVIGWLAGRPKTGADTSAVLIDKAVTLMGEIGEFSEERAEYWRLRWEDCRAAHEPCVALVAELQDEIVRLRAIRNGDGESG